ncbi:transglutaminase-like domain-containing protein [Sporosarcina thermotolerans]|uniref:Transglutaminase-like domain-containing protein n=1 Tax=Sporosarcina thermotolerans TaxID=633404 RepID=A0AAW9ACZ8_9BACL|nr:transglutaminase-like domain-containing protein [Sporosarcina thermotolerans]MDW0117501.1 transglutaminase-like domain-containing protein [Sporosarcina thermotolerans]WHT49669.1 transglutaminase-like domain-containing protein [Sporosarcina thermotolerans]
MFMKKMYLLFVLLVLVACSNDPPIGEVKHTEENKQHIDVDEDAWENDFTYTPEGQEAGLSILIPTTSMLNASRTFTLTGMVDPAKIKHEEILIELKKDGYLWKDVLLVVNGEFTYDIPLFFGKGIHDLVVYVPDKEYDDYFQVGTSMQIDNGSDYWDDIHYSPTYVTRGINFESPSTGGNEANLTYRIKGSIDMDAQAAKETTHLVVTTSKNDDYADYIIPVEDYKFDDEIYLRFGPGKYFVTVGVAKKEETNRAIPVYNQVAQFIVENTSAEDLRDLLPSRGVQSDAPEIIALSNELIKDSMSDREKAKAVYEYTAKTISYNTGKLYFIGNQWDDSALKTLKFKTGICVDFAYLAIALLRAAEMEARYVVGTAGFGDDREGHAWVEVKVDGEWLTMDPTWGSGYIDYGRFEPEYTEDYFDPTEEVFSSHVKEGVAY